MSEALAISHSDDAAIGGDAGRRARFRRFALTDFRSYARAAIALDGRPAAFSGANGAGKTNILEALSLLGPGRGLRSARLDELPRVEGPGGWAVSARLESSDGDEISLGVGAAANAPDRRQCRIEERAASGPSAFAEHVGLVWLTPAQDRLFMEGAGERRRFIDRMTLARDAAHGRSASAYEKAMRQRQKLLDDRVRDADWLEALEAQMAEAGVAIAAARRETAALLASSEIGGEVFPAGDIALEGVLETALAGRAAADVEEDFAARLKDQRYADAHAGRALIGPHRSDLLVTHRAKARPARLCSTGEQKALLIGLVLANARSLSRTAHGGAPARRAPLIILLDEIAAHLDPDRRAALFDILDEIGFQAFMTGTDRSLFSAWGDRAQHFTVADGAVTQTNL
ncbi:MAG: DNA replication/repair protein RecF [Pseudomonadota bacterium]